MIKAIITISIIFLLFSTIYGQKKQNLKIDYMLSGYIFAKSSIIDTTAFGGFGSSDNLPKIINKNNILSDSGLLLKIDTTQSSTFYEKFNGFKLFLANKTDSIVQFDASDSRLNIIAEVFYEGEWKPIVYLPSSWCGNSHHIVYLKQNEYWEFDIPKFTGKLNTKLRYKLTLSRDNNLYSNEIQTSINKGQFKNKQNYKSKGLMDSY